jgi:hypothetical protein
VYVKIPQSFRELIEVGLVGLALAAVHWLLAVL